MSLSLADPKYIREQYIYYWAPHLTPGKKMNGSIFKGYLHDLQEAISNIWRITPQVVA
jgi:hypothetical protein